MKNKFYAFLLIGLVAIAIASCYTSRSRYGCPGNPTSSSRFRG